jgi:TRAP-type C4-dicarboxylate transport system permease small subunit
MTSAILTPDQPDELEKASRVVSALVTTERVVATIALVVTLVLILLQVTSRYIFNAPLGWTEQTARFTLVWLTFVSGGFVMARRGHIAVDLMVDRLGLKSKRVVNGFSILTVLIASAIMTLASVQLALATMGLKLPAAGIPVSLLYLAVTVGFLLIFVHGVLSTVFDLRHRKKPTLETVDGETGAA